MAQIEVPVTMRSMTPRLTELTTSISWPSWLSGKNATSTCPAMLDAADLAAAASGTLDVSELAIGLKAAGISDNHGLAADLMTELREHALQIALQDRERDELLTSGRPHYELPMIPDGIDLAGLYQLAAALREQGAA